MFKVLRKKGKARHGKLRTAHGDIETPFFMPIATKGAVKGIDALDLENAGAQIALANTYHLWLRPGEKIISKSQTPNSKLAGLHSFMNWNKPILSDSGGYQVFSLAKLRKVTDRGVEFRSHLDGEKKLLTPEKAIQIQKALGVDIAMVLDECVGYPSTKKRAEEAVERTTKWAKRCLAENKKEKTKNKKPLLFGIVQGSSFKDLRIRSAEEISALSFDGVAIGGVAVGESPTEMFKQVDYCVDLLPEDKPRYLMGVGFPEQIIEAVKRGIDMFDCVIPTRFARHGILFKSQYPNPKSQQGSNPKLQKMLKSKKRVPKKDLYELIRIGNEKYKTDSKPVDENCDCYTCKHYSRMYLRHLYSSGEPLYTRLATIHNLHYYLKLMEGIRLGIKK